MTAVGTNANYQRDQNSLGGQRNPTRHNQATAPEGRGPELEGLIFKHSASSQALLLVRFCCSFLFFASWTKGWKTWECDEFPRARTSFERALHLKTTCFASVGDILKAVDEENRHDLRY
jgi:hypothetical protein